MTLLGMHRGTLLPGLHITPSLARVTIVNAHPPQAPAVGFRSN